MIMNDEVYDAYREAGALARKVLHRGAGLVKEGAGILEMVEETEAMVTDEGAILAFPLNVSLNEAAAHDTAMPGDERMFAAGDLVKVDLGVQVDGYIADTALTVDLGDHAKLVGSSRQPSRSTTINRSQTSPGTASTATTSTQHPPSRTSR
jgi:methionyl aminopeptidase